MFLFGALINIVRHVCENAFSPEERGQQPHTDNPHPAGVVGAELPGHAHRPLRAVLSVTLGRLQFAVAALLIGRKLLRPARHLVVTLLLPLPPLLGINYFAALIHNFPLSYKKIYLIS